LEKVGFGGLIEGEERATERALGRAGASRCVCVCTSGGGLGESDSVAREGLLGGRVVSTRSMTRALYRCSGVMMMELVSGAWDIIVIAMWTWLEKIVVSSVVLWSWCVETRSAGGLRRRQTYMLLETARQGLRTVNIAGSSSKAE